jgi:hypothetical protein
MVSSLLSFVVFIKDHAGLVFGQGEVKEETGGVIAVPVKDIEDTEELNKDDEKRASLQSVQ